MSYDYRDIDEASLNIDIYDMDQAKLREAYERRAASCVTDAEGDEVYASYKRLSNDLNHIEEVRKEIDSWSKTPAVPSYANAISAIQSSPEYEFTNSEKRLKWWYEHIDTFLFRLPVVAILLFLGVYIIQHAPTGSSDFFGWLGAVLGGGAVFLVGLISLTPLSLNMIPCLIIEKIYHNKIAERYIREWRERNNI